MKKAKIILKTIKQISKEKKIPEALVTWKQISIHLACLIKKINQEVKNDTNKCSN